MFMSCSVWYEIESQMLEESANTLIILSNNIGTSDLVKICYNLCEVCVEHIVILMQRIMLSY